MSWEVTAVQLAGAHGAVGDIGDYCLAACLAHDAVDCYTVDGIHTHVRAAYCLAHGVVDVLTQSMPFGLLPCSLARGAVGDIGGYCRAAYLAQDAVDCSHGR